MFHRLRGKESLRWRARKIQQLSHHISYHTENRNDCSYKNGLLPSASLESTVLILTESCLGRYYTREKLVTDRVCEYKISWYVSQRHFPMNGSGVGQLLVEAVSHECNRTIGFVLAPS